ncbi:MAG: arginase family protein [Solirubrobacterales bacterium]|nr:arginase family protein [Solirubrobacterales bacterium]
MTVEIIVSRGRVGDRTPGAIAGAELTAAAISGRLGAPAHEVGSPTPPARDDWSESLPQAREHLVELGERVDGAIGRGNLPLLVTNTCSASLASLPVMARRHPEAILLWVDAHGDFNTPETTASGYLGGMVLAAACGLWESGHGAGLDPRDIALIGARDVDPPEAELIRRHGVELIPPGEADPARIAELCGDRPVWIHIDWDVLEPGFVPAGYRVPGGLVPREIARLLAGLDPDRIVGLELAEFEASGEAGRDQEAIASILEAVGELLDGLSQ